MKVWEHPSNSDMGTANRNVDSENSDVGSKISDVEPQNPPGCSKTL